MKQVLLILVLCVNTALAQTSNSVTQYGITWTFDKSYETGKFANGDCWVVPDTAEGTVTIVNITPSSTEVNGNILHGSMVNPQAKDGRQGFDERLASYSSEDNKARPGGADLSVKNPLVLSGGSSLVSSISNLTTPKWTTQDMALSTALVLTVLKTTPPEGSFRPAYAGEDKEVKYNIADIDYSALGSMALMGTDIGNLTAYESMVERPWLDFISGPAGSYMHPEKNMAGDGGMLSSQVGEIALILNSSDYTNTEKAKLLIGFIQVGIDNYGVHDEVNTSWNTWNNNGQIGPGRKFPILFAGKVLNNPLAAEMLNIGDVSIDAVGYGGSGYVSFAEDEQTFYVTAHPNSATDAQKRAIWQAGTDQDYDIFVPDPDDPVQPYRKHFKDAGYFGHANPEKRKDYNEYMAGSYVAGTEFEVGAGHEGMPEWGIIHGGIYWTHQNKAYDGLNWSAPYRQSNGKYWAGWILAAHSMGLQEYWNHDALFDYMDRYMAISPSQSPDWIRSMWEMHRGQINTIPPTNQASVTENDSVSTQKNTAGATLIDDFSSDTTSSYTVEYPAGVATDFLYDAPNQRLNILTGDNIDLLFSRGVTAADTGRFSLDFLPVTKYPNGGRLTIILRQDADNYYQFTTTDGYEPGSLIKVVNGVTVSSKNLAQGYTQNTDYPVSIDFTPQQITLDAIGQTISLNSDPTAIRVQSFSVYLGQQDAYIDNLRHEANQAPVALDDSVSTPQNTAVDIPVLANDSDVDGTINVETVAISSASSHGSTVVQNDGTLTYTPDVDFNGSDSFTYTVEDDDGALSNEASVAVNVSVAGTGTAFTDDFSSDTTSSYTVEYPAGVATDFLYDAPNQRLNILTGDNIDLLFSRGVTAADTGRFSLDFLPVTKYPNGGRLRIILKQDADNYYQFTTTDGYEPGSLIKVVNGVTVSSENLAQGYTQNTDYPVSIDFNPQQITLDAIGQTISLNSDPTAIRVQSFSVYLGQQDAYIDNIEHEANQVPVAGTTSTDDFSSDTTSSYTVEYPAGVATDFLYDAPNQRLNILTGDNIDLLFSRGVTAADTGRFSLDFLPVTKYPNGGRLTIILRQDADNYYQFTTTDGYEPGSLIKVVNGVTVSSENLAQGYTQNTDYPVSIDFTPQQITLDAIGQTISLNSDPTAIRVQSFSVYLGQQDAYIDNIEHEANQVPVAGTTSTDDFSSDTTSSYTLEYPAGVATDFLYDAPNQRLNILTGDNIDLLFSRGVTAADTGRFSLDFLPVTKYPNGGRLRIILKQDADNYYQFTTTDGYEPGSLIKVVNGVTVSSENLAQGYTQNTDYPVSIDFNPQQITLDAIGQTISLNSDPTAIRVQSFSVYLGQQDAYIDNIEHEAN